MDNKKLEEFILRFPMLVSVAEKLNKASINWLIGGSGCLFLLGNKRIPDDVDIFLPNGEHDTVDQLFNIKSYTHTSKAGPVRNSNPEDNHSIQFTSHLEFNFDKQYKFGITESIKQKKIQFEYSGVNLYLLPPEDVLLIKALLQRGPEEGKKDIEDINNFLKIYQIDNNYLNERIKELDAKERVGNIF
ncbi:MAG: nucleotidyltransferase [bacterium]|nr:nucleotidyltransferase [bacterium]